MKFKRKTDVQTVVDQDGLLEDLEFAEFVLENLHTKDIYQGWKNLAGKKGKKMDIVADSLIRIKNGYLAHKGEVILPYSKLVLAICEVLKKEGYIEESKVAKKDGKESLNDVLVTLRYESRKPAVSGIRRISKPGLRIYKSKNSLPYVLNGLGLAIISTPKGVMSDKQARKEGVGGEVMAYVW